MAQLIVRNLEDDLVRLLKHRAAEHGVSAEEEHRRLLRRALRPQGLLDQLREMPDVGDDEMFERQHELPRHVDL